MPIEDFREGDTFQSPSRTLTDAHFLLFSGLTYDNHPIHYDVEYARRTPFGRPLAHGLLLMAITALGGSSAASRLDGFVFVEQGCRFLKPAMVGDTLTPRHRIERIWSEGHRRYCRVATTITNQRGETVLEGFHVYRVKPGGEA